MIYIILGFIIILQLIIIYMIYTSLIVTRENQITINDNLKTINNNIVIVDEKQ